MKIPILCFMSTLNSLVEKVAFSKEKGLIKTGCDMSAPEAEGVWEIGDCAAIFNKQYKNLSPPTVQFAVRQGK